MDIRKISQIADQLSNESTRRTAAKRLGALALGGLTVGLVGRGADAHQINPKNPKVDKRCLNRCIAHQNHNCHDLCRRKR
ncbi:MAG TPA: hypothetical protein VFQ80_07290 [Thermomicrobiales bacterium]|nr:hypothetical protein [Thermomicrobiales bacterium]